MVSYREAVPTSSSPAGIVVLGMHRSGTSAITRAINLLGFNLGRADDLYRAHDNPAGHWESTALIQCNDRILTAFGGAWDVPPRLNRGWSDTERARALRDDARTTFDDVYGGAGTPWLWKDPRLCLTLPLWRAVLDDVVIVMMTREPGPVVRSLVARDGVSEAYAVAMWEHYVVSMLSAAIGFPTITVEYEAVVTDPIRAITQLRDDLTGLGLESSAAVTDAASSISPSRPEGTKRSVQLPPHTQALAALVAALPRVSASFTATSHVREPASNSIRFGVERARRRLSDMRRRRF